MIQHGLDDYLTFCKMEGECLELVGFASSIEEARIQKQELRPDIILLDVWLNSHRERQLSLPLMQDFSGVPVIIYTGETQNLEILNEFWKAGIQGLVFKIEPPKILLEAIYAVYTGSTFFSPEVRKVTGWAADTLSEYHHQLRLPKLSRQEATYLWWVLHGAGRALIAEKMKVAVSTVSEYRERAFAKLNISHLKELNRKYTLTLLADIFADLS